MKASVVSYPPLGEITISESSTVTFTAAIYAENITSHKECQVALWYSTGRDWQELLLEPKADEVHIIQDKISDNIDQCLYFTAELNLTDTLHFTIKFSCNNEGWRWAKDNQRSQDGTLILRKDAQAHIEHTRTEVSSTLQYQKSHDLKDLIGDLSPEIEYKQVSSQTPSTSVWSASTLIDGAQGSVSSFKKVKFGKPWQGSFLRWFALVRIWSPWLCPRQGRQHFQLDKDAVMCSFLDAKGRHMVILAISGVNDILNVIQSDEDGNVMLNIRNDQTTAQTARIVVAVGDKFELANAAAMYEARNIVMGHEHDTGFANSTVQAVNDGVDAKWMENWFDGLTYCTWNGLGQQLTEEKVFNAIDVLAQNGINITNLIIDDNWQNLDYRGESQFQHGWSTFEADPNTFPSGLKAVTSKIRKDHPNIQHIAVWHALWGYWGGIDPDGQLAKSYKTTEVIRVDSTRRNLPLGGKLTLIAKEDVNRFYEDFYTFLADSGVDAVKTDAQFMFDTLKDADDRRDLFNSYLDAWTISSLKHFSIKAISCMSQTPQILFHSQLPSNHPAILVRNSDDFFPEIASSHAWHVWTNAHNALFTQHLNVIPDWDMFQTVHEYSGFHAAARCVSGGPIYITDVPGSHDLNLIKQMSGMTTRGKSVVFRPSVVGKSLDQYVDYKDEVLLKIGCYHGSAESGTSMIGIFNVSPVPLSELLHLSRFPGTIEAQLYIVRSHISGKITPPLQTANSSAIIPLHFAVRGYDILSAYPLRGFWTPTSDGASGKDGSTTWLASLGLTEKMASAATIAESSMTTTTPTPTSTNPISYNGSTRSRKHPTIHVMCALKALGVYGLYISTLASLTIDDNFMVLIQGQTIPRHCVSIAECVLQIDCERAWRGMKLSPGWSNEVRVEILLLRD